jgi:hypothetical protein
MAKSKSKRTNKSRINNKKARRVILIILLSIVVIMTVVHIVGGIIVDREINKRSVSDTTEQANITSYLKNKYNQDFDVEKPSCDGGAFGISCVWSTNAYPKSDKSIKIHISRVDNQTKYSDDYVVRTWQKEQTAKIQPKVREIFKDMPVDVKVRLGVIDPDVERTFTLKKPTFEEVFLAENKDKYGLTIYSIAIRYRGDGEMPKNDIAGRLFEMMQYIRLQGVSRVSSSVLDISGKDRRGVFCSVDENISLESVKRCLDNISVLPKEDLVW